MTILKAIASSPIALLLAVVPAIALKKRKWEKVERTDNGWIERSDDVPPKLRHNQTDSGV